MPTIVRVFCMVLLAALALQAHAADEAQMREVRSTPDYRFPTNLRLVDQRVVFSAYSANGNDSDVIEIDPADGVPKLLVRSERGARFVAADSRYLIFSRERSNAHQLIALDRVTGEERGSVRLRSGAPWAHIHGERLVVLQYREALFLRLPDLKVEKTQPLGLDGFEAQVWKDRIVALTGRGLRIYDFALSAFTELAVPASSTAGRRCAPGSLRIHQDLAIINAHCAEFVVYDLSKEALLRVIPGQAAYHTFDVLEGLLLAAGTDAVGKSEIHVFELATGRELARLATQAQAQVLAARAGTLLAMHSYATGAKFTVYEPDFVAMLSERGRETRVLAACGAVDRVDDFARAIDACEAAGVRAYLEASALSPRLGAALGNYAGYLARTLSRYDEAIPMLEGMRPTPQREASLALARRKAALFSTPRHADAPALPGLRKEALEFNALPSDLIFEADRAYVARWSCGGPEAEGVMLDVFDRRTYSKTGSAQVAPCDDDYQDELLSITPLGKHLVLGLGSRYESDQRTNVVVLDSVDLKITARGHLETAPVQMGEWQGRLLLCGSETGGPNMRLDTSDAALVAASREESLACLNGEVSRTGKRFDFGPADGEPIATTRGFKVYDAGRTSFTRTLRFLPSGTGEAFSHAGVPPIGAMTAAPDRDAMIWSHSRGLENRFVYYDIATRRERTLFALKQSERFVGIVVWGHCLFVALQRDLIVYDLARHLLVHYEKELVDDMDRVLLDEDRLIVSSYGKGSRVIDLPVLVASFDGRELFAP